VRSVSGPRRRLALLGAALESYMMPGYLELMTNVMEYNKDMPNIALGYSARCLGDHLPRLVSRRLTLERILELVDEPSNLTILQALQFYAICMDFRPSLIIEIGRGRGNSTCVFAQAVADASHGRIVSFDLERLWNDDTVPRLQQSELSALLTVIDARIQNVKSVDFSTIVGDSRRVLVFWDAHGWAAADGVLCRLLPAVLDREHLVICHDASDSRYVFVNRSYDEKIFWRGDELKGESARYTIGWVNTREPQFLPLHDFLWRNDCPLHSADEDLHWFREVESVRQAQIEEMLGEQCFMPGCHWVYFSLDEARAPPTFPRLPAM
jgi:hypothetical protein